MEWPCNLKVWLRPRNDLPNVVATYWVRRDELHLPAQFYALYKFEKYFFFYLWPTRWVLQFYPLWNFLSANLYVYFSNNCRTSNNNCEAHNKAFAFKQKQPFEILKRPLRIKWEKWSHSSLKIAKLSTPKRFQIRWKLLQMLNPRSDWILDCDWTNWGIKWKT